MKFVIIIRFHGLFVRNYYIFPCQLLYNECKKAEGRIDIMKKIFAMLFYILLSCNLLLNIYAEELPLIEEIMIEEDFAALENETNNTEPLLIPETPVLNKAASYSYNKIKIHWYPVEHVEGYQVYRKVPGGRWKKIQELSGNDVTSYLDTKLETNQTYLYTVRGYYTVDGKKTLTGYDAAGVSAKPMPNKSAITSIENKMPGELTIHWKKISGAHGYRVYRVNEDESLKYLTQISDGSVLSYTDAGLNVGETYRYRVRAYRTVNDKKAFGLYSAITSADCTVSKIDKPILVKAASYSYNKIKITWNPVDEVDGYRVYRKTTDGSWKSIKVLYDGTLSSYIDTTAETGTTYIYTVKAFFRAPDKIYWSSHDTTGVKAKAVPNKSEVKKIDNSIACDLKISWKKISGASGYRIYVMGDDGKYTLLKQVKDGSNLSYTHTDLEWGKTYIYKVRAYRTVNGKPVFGAYSTPKTGIVLEPDFNFRATLKDYGTNLFTGAHFDIEIINSSSKNITLQNKSAYYSGDGFQGSGDIMIDAGKSVTVPANQAKIITYRNPDIKYPISPSYYSELSVKYIFLYDRKEYTGICTEYNSSFRYREELYFTYYEE